MMEAEGGGRRESFHREGPTGGFSKRKCNLLNIKWCTVVCFRKRFLKQITKLKAENREFGVTLIDFKEISHQVARLAHPPSGIG